MCVESFVPEGPGWRSSCASWRAMAAPRCSRGPWPGLSALFVLGLWCWASFVAPTGRVVPASTYDNGGDGGGLHDTKPSCGVSPACRALVSCNSPRVVARARDLRGCGRQSADPLGDKSPKATVLAEWDCTLVDVVSVVVYWSHANPLYRTRTRYLECGRGCPCSH